MDERPNMDSLDRYPLRHQWLPDRPHRAYSCNGDVDAMGDESLYRPSQLGRAYAEPDEVEAGARGDLTLTYVAGPAGVPEGATVTFVIRGQFPLGKAGDAEPRVSGPAHCTLEAVDRLCFRVAEGSLREGDAVTLHQPEAIWAVLAGRKELKVVINTGDGRPEQRLPEPVVIQIRPRAAARVEATGPCTRRAGDPVRLQVTTRDEFDNRAPLRVSGTVALGEEREDVCLRNGFDDAWLRPVGDGVARARVTVDDGLTCASNPCVTTDDLQLYVGDLHCHDYLSQAEGYTDQVYRWALEDRNLDFISVSVQSHGWHDNEKWTLVKYMNERYLEEGRFVTFLGFEWQHSYFSDKVVHFLGGDQPYLPVDDPRYDTPGKLYQALEPSDALVISHHVCYPIPRWVPGVDWDVVDTQYERLVEIWSMHGSGEGYDPADRPLKEVDPSRTAMAALRRGLRLGLVAGSDTHSARPGGSAKEPLAYWGGLAAVWAPDLTRRDVFSSLWARRTYALTGARIVLRMTVNDAWMGSEIPLGDRADIRIDVWAPGDIAKVELMKDTRVLHTFTPGGDECHLEYEDVVDSPAFYHCRVTQTDGHLAVCSPVWVG